MSHDTAQLKIFTGQFQHAIDPKNRITIPSAWRSEEGADFFVRIHGMGNANSHLVAMPRASLDKKIAAIESRKDIDLDKQQKLIRKVTAGVLICSADKQGRMVLPADFCTKAEVKGEVTVVGAHDTFEVWNTERWAAQQSDDDDEIGDLAKQLGI